MAGPDEEECTALPFLAVGRVKDAVTLASYSVIDSDQQREQTEDIFKKLLAAARQKLKPGQRTRLQWKDGSVCCLMDQQGDLLFCVVTSFTEYPDKYAYQLLQEFMASVHAATDFQSVGENGLNTELQSKMQELLTKYADPNSFDSYSNALEKVNVVKSVMQDNLRQVADTGKSLQDLQKKTGDMEGSAGMFNESSRQVLVNVQRRKMKMYAIAAGVCVFVLLLLLWWCGIFSSKKKEAETSTRRLVVVDMLHNQEIAETLQH